MKVCPERRALMSYENGELTDAEAGPIERHLRTCQTCRDSMSQIRAANADTRRFRTAFQEARRDAAFEVEGESCAAGEAGADGARPPAASERDAVLELPADRAAEPGSPPSRPGTPRSDERAGRSTAELSAGDWIIPDYERVLLCGEGSYGSVWAVRDRVGVYRALKIIDVERMRRAGVSCRERSALEAYCRKVSRHPYLITIYHVGVVGPYLYYTMELADDRTTRGSVHDGVSQSYRPLTLDLIVRAHRLDVDVAIEIARRLLRGLAKLHDLDLVHRDIKPSNIVFVNRHPKLADIGVMTSDTQSARVIGTPRYMPPDKVMDKTADIYAFGKMLHEMLAGRDAPTFPALPEEHLWGSMRWDLQRVSDVIVHACADHASDRYPNAYVMLEDLEASAKLPFDSLFEGLDSSEEPSRITVSQAALQLGFAFIRSIPWILLFIAIMYAIARLT
ncbi:MAG: protein kinase [Phycisphaerae bacterium]